MGSIQKIFKTYKNITYFGQKHQSNPANLAVSKTLWQICLKQFNPVSVADKNEL